MALRMDGKFSCILAKQQSPIYILRLGNGFCVQKNSFSLIFLLALGANRAKSLKKGFHFHAQLYKLQSHAKPDFYAELSRRKQEKFSSDLRVKKVIKNICVFNFVARKRPSKFVKENSEKRVTRRNIDIKKNNGMPRGLVPRVVPCHTVFAAAKAQG